MEISITLFLLILKNKLKNVHLSRYLLVMKGIKSLSQFAWWLLVVVMSGGMGISISIRFPHCLATGGIMERVNWALFLIFKVIY
nr:hypothetical protein [Providencia stuartii]